MRKSIEDDLGVQVLQTSQPRPHGKPTFWIAGGDFAKLQPLSKETAEKFDTIQRIWLQRLRACLFLNVEFQNCIIRGLFDDTRTVEQALSELEERYFSVRDWRRVEQGRWREFNL